ncbi:MAG: glycosyltransferase family 4 protein [bacterium]
MINVLHVIDKLSMDGINPSSCAQLFAEWYARHETRRFRVMVANLRAQDSAGEYLEKRGLEVFYIGQGKFSLANVRAIASLVDERQVDVLHLHGYSSANFGRLAARHKRIPAVMHEHAILKILPHQFIADWWLSSKTDIAVAVSNAVADFLHKGRHVPREKIHVIWNGIDLQAFRRPDRRTSEEFRGRYAGRSQKLIGTVTRLREEKGNRYFIRAAHEVLRHFPEARFVLVGEGPERGVLEKLAAQFGIQDRVHFAGFVHDVPSALAAFDVAVIPSLREGFGLALAEAMAADKPVIATRVGGMVEMAGHEQEALLVPPADAPALAQAILEMVTDPSKAERLGAAASRRSNDFSMEKNVAALEALYERLALGRQKSLMGTSTARTQTDSLSQRELTIRI